MRTALTCLASLLAAGVGPAQTPPYAATVVADNVVLRSGPGLNMEETGPLARGEEVAVVQEHGEQWLAVEPPRGQVSWVRTIKLQEVGAGGARTVPRNMVVAADPTAEVAMGRPGLGSPLGVRRDLIPDGTVVLVIGPDYVEATGSGSTRWTPIQPVKGECRFIPRSAVQVARGQPAPTYSVQSPAPRVSTPGEAETTQASGVARIPALAVPAGAASGRGKPADWPSHPLWLQAEEASGRQEYQRAERLYLQLASDMNQPGGDVELANLCYSRVHAVLEKQRAAGRPAKVSSSPAGADRDATDRSAARTGEPRWTSPGTIRETGFGRDAGAKYSFRSAATGKVVAYLDAGPGVDLGQWREAEVKLYATVRPSQDAGDVPLLNVTRVERAGSRRD